MTRRALPREGLAHALTSPASMSLNSRPKELALVTGRPSITQL